MHDQVQIHFIESQKIIRVSLKLLISDVLVSPVRIHGLPDSSPPSSDKCKKRLIRTQPLVFKHHLEGDPGDGSSHKDSGIFHEKSCAVVQGTWIAQELPIATRSLAVLSSTHARPPITAAIFLLVILFDHLILDQGARFFFDLKELLVHYLIIPIVEFSDKGTILETSCNKVLVSDIIIMSTRRHSRFGHVSHHVGVFKQHRGGEAQKHQFYVAAVLKIPVHSYSGLTIHIVNRSSGIRQDAIYPDQERQLFGVSEKCGNEVKCNSLLHGVNTKHTDWRSGQLWGHATEIRGFPLKTRDFREPIPGEIGCKRQHRWTMFVSSSVGHGKETKLSGLTSGLTQRKPGKGLKTRMISYSKNIDWIVTTIE